ncbi:MAG: hypothetical protein LBP87_01735 [Planctomycetaceae bacterium]|nr:hypothetical protein [Planctomycetaceae bacterium]
MNSFASGILFANPVNSVNPIQTFVRWVKTHRYLGMPRWGISNIAGGFNRRKIVSQAEFYLPIPSILLILSKHLSDGLKPITTLGMPRWGISNIAGGFNCRKIVSQAELFVKTFW